MIFNKKMLHCGESNLKLFNLYQKMGRLLFSLLTVEF